MHITVLGGGPAGCAVGYYAKKNGLDFTIYEADSEAGGFCRTLSRGAFFYDTGAHRFHDKIPDITDDIKELLGNELKQIYVPSQIWTDAKFVDFPLSPFNLARVLGVVRFCRAALEVIRARAEKSKLEHINFEEFARYTYGHIIAERFLINYSEKLWGKTCARLSPKIAGKRMEGLDLRTFVKEALFGKKAKTEHLDGMFYYPVYGYGSIVKSMISYFGRENIRTNCEITALFSEGRRITAVEINHREVLDVDEIVTTLPLHVFLGMLHPAPPRELFELVNKICHRDLILIVIFLDRASITKNATVYFPDSDFPFTRVYEPKNRSQLMSPPEKTTLVIELPCQHGDSYWRMSDAELTQLALSKLIDIGWFTCDQVIDSEVHRRLFAYPILERGYENTVEEIVAYLENFENLKLSGRNGKFSYTHFHDMMAYGKEIVQGYVSSGSEGRRTD